MAIYRKICKHYLCLAGHIIHVSCVPKGRSAVWMARSVMPWPTCPSGRGPTQNFVGAFAIPTTGLYRDTKPTVENLDHLLAAGMSILGEHSCGALERSRFIQIGAQSDAYAEARYQIGRRYVRGSKGRPSGRARDSQGAGRWRPGNRRIFIRLTTRGECPLNK